VQSRGGNESAAHVAPAAAAATSTLRWSEADAADQTTSEGNCEFIGCGSGDELGLIESTAKPLERMKGHSRNQARPRSIECALGAQAGQAAKREGCFHIPRKLKAKDKLFDLAFVNSPRSASVEAQSYSPAPRTV
jgi:hypothetical protein